jgi:drug/metabolite transporter (DMT)-like permease
LVLVVVLSLGAAFLFAGAATVQQQAIRVVVRRAPRAPRASLRQRIASDLPVLLVVQDLLRSRAWLAGWVVNLLGFFTQAAALHFGSVALVQPLMVTQLLFTLPLVSLRSRRWPLRREWFAGAVICVGVTVFLSVRGGISSAGSADRSSILLAGGSMLVLCVLLVVLSARRRPVVHATMVAIAAGLCFAMSAVLIQLTTADLIHRGVGATACDWPGYALAGSTGLGLLLEHEAFGAGPLPITMTAMTITNPVASYLIGVLAFDVVPPTSPGDLAAISASAALLTIGTVILARSPRVRRDAANTTRARGQVCQGMS